MEHWKLLWKWHDRDAYPQWLLLVEFCKTCWELGVRGYRHKQLTSNFEHFSWGISVHLLCIRIKLLRDRSVPREALEPGVVA